MSGYPYQDKIRNEDKIDYKTVFSSDGLKIGEVEALFSDSFIVRNMEENEEVKCQIPREEIEKIITSSITLRSKKSYLDQKYQTSSINKADNIGNE